MAYNGAIAMRSFDTVERLFDEMDRSLAEMRRSMRPYAGRPTAAFERPALETSALPTPSFDWRGDEEGVTLEDEGDEYVFAMDLPGFDREEIEVTFEGDVLSIRAHTEAEEGSDAIRSMRSRRVARQVPIPKAVVEDEITAAYRNGVLEVHLPIVADEREESGRRIDVE